MPYRKPQSTLHDSLWHAIMLCYDMLCHDIICYADTCDVMLVFPLYPILSCTISSPLLSTPLLFTLLPFSSLIFSLLYFCLAHLMHIPSSPTYPPLTLPVFTIYIYQLLFEMLPYCEISPPSSTSTSSLVYWSYISFIPSFSTHLNLIYLICCIFFLFLTHRNAYHTLFVARISFDTTEKKLRREFEQYGPVRTVKMINDKSDKAR